MSLSETSALTQLAPNPWTLAHPLRLGLVEFDHAMTVIQLNDNQLWIHSPVAYSPAMAQTLEVLDTTAFFIAPNTFHDLYWRACGLRPTHRRAPTPCPACAKRT